MGTIAMDQIEINTISNVDNNVTVMVRNAYKSYVSTNPILNGLNLTVPKGIIYGLLGPSGCGKTTLLNCIAGRMTLDSGSIKLNVQKRVQMGYMPQSLSLHGAMTILESFFFYGYLYGMDTEIIEARAKELIAFLDLPSKNRLVRDLSGGQQRRVSLAITIFHDPKLIILDEPTVGLDPILSESIWDHLVKMTADGKTIIITTHYIQEAKRAHVIGLLRNGRLLAEENPQSLIRKYNCDDLEEVFLKLCESQETESNKLEFLQTRSKSPDKIIFDEDTRLFSKKKFIGITYKYQTLLKREYTLLVLLLTLPFLESAFFCMNTGRNPKNVNVAVINEEIPIAECEHITYSECFLNENQSVPLSCLYLDLLGNNTYNFIEYSNETKAMEDLRRNKVRGLMYFHENYTRSLAGRFLYSRDENENFDDFLNGSVDTRINLGDQVIGNIIKYDITRRLELFMKQAFENCEISFRAVWTPIAFEKPIFGSFDVEFINYTSIALLTILCFFLPAFSTANRIFQERKEGILERMLTAGVSITEIILSTMLIETIVYIVQYIIIGIVLFCIFDTPHEGNLLIISGLMLLTALSGMFYGIAIAVTHKTEMLLGYSGMGTNLLLSLVTGVISSTEAAHKIIKTINWIFPLTLTIDAARGIAVRSLPITHPIVLKGIASTISWLLFFLLAIIITLKYKKNTLLGG